MKLPVALLNTSIMTEDGSWSLKTISVETARGIVSEAVGLDSAIGHEATAVVLSELLGVDVPINRQEFRQQVGQTAVVFKLAHRPPEGSILTVEMLEEYGYTLKEMTRHGGLEGEQ